MAAEPNLADLWAGRARFKVEAGSYGTGVFFSMWPSRGQTMVFNIASNGPSDGRLAIGLATTSDGVNFSNRGIVIRPGPAGWDSKMASFPGVWKMDETSWAIVYEGSGTSPGDIGLATSIDGFKFTKEAAPILVHAVRRPGEPALDLRWERNNIGTPSLYVINGVRYLFYHGYGKSSAGGPDDCQVGVATGTDLRSMKRYAGNPIMRTGPSGSWDCGTIGKRSIRREADGYFYMVCEGSTDQPYGAARWSSGVARSADLLRWEKFGGNPVLPQTSRGFGYDGPEFLQTPDGKLRVYFRNPSGPTSRATLVWK